LRRRETLMYYVYILKCENETDYVGCTNDLEDRIKRHIRKRS